MEAQMKARLNQSITLESYLSQTGAGVPSYAAAVTIKGFIVGRLLFRTNRIGEQVYSQQTVFVDETKAALIKTKDRLTLPGGLVCLVKDTQIFYSPKGPIDFGEVYL